MLIRSQIGWVDRVRLWGSLGASSGLSAANPATFDQVIADYPWVAGNILDGSDPAVTPANGGTIVTWVDASAVAHNATAGGTPKYDTTNGIHNATTDYFTFTALTLTGDFTIWVWAVLSDNASGLVVLGRTNGKDALTITSGASGSLILQDNNENRALTNSVVPTSGLKLVRFRRSGTTTYVAWTGTAEFAMADLTDLGAGTLAFSAILASAAGGSIDTYSATSAYLKWLVVANEAVVPLTANDRARIELYIAGAALT